MDKFIQKFKEKVIRAKQPEMNQGDWESFLAFKKLNTFNIPVKTSFLAKYKIALIGAASVAGISLFAYFALTKPYSNPETTTNEQKVPEIKIEKPHEINDNQLIENDSILALGKNVVPELKTQNNELTTKENASGLSSQLNNAGNRTNKNTEVNYDFNKDIAVDNSKLINKIINTQKENLSEYNSTELVTNLSDDKSVLSSNAENSLSGYLPSKSLFFPRNYNILFDTTYIKIIIQKEKKSPDPKFRLSGSFVYVRGLKDRMNISDFFAQKISGNCYITKRMRAGLDYTSANLRSSIYKKENYPFLNDIKPHHPDEMLDDLTINASLKKIGVVIKYDIIQKNRFISAIGLGIQREVATRYDFRLKVRDKNGKPYFQDMNKVEIADRRYFLSPGISAEYRIFNSFNIYSSVQFDISLSEYKEQYLSLDAGITYCF
jgi:hypothetical protein